MLGDDGSDLMAPFMEGDGLQGLHSGGPLGAHVAHMSEGRPWDERGRTHGPSRGTFGSMSSGGDQGPSMRGSQFSGQPSYVNQPHFVTHASQQSQRQGGPLHSVHASSSGDRYQDVPSLQHSGALQQQSAFSMTGESSYDDGSSGRFDARAVHDLRARPSSESVASTGFNYYNAGQSMAGVAHSEFPGWMNASSHGHDFVPSSHQQQLQRQQLHPGYAEDADHPQQHHYSFARGAGTQGPAVAAHISRGAWGPHTAHLPPSHAQEASLSEATGVTWSSGAGQNPEEGTENIATAHQEGSDETRRGAGARRFLR